MADYTFYDVTSVRREYVLRSPSNWSEVSKVIAALEQEITEGDSDDRVTVEAKGDEIVFWYEKSSERT